MEILLNPGRRTPTELQAQEYGQNSVFRTLHYASLNLQNTTEAPSTSSSINKAIGGASISGKKPKVGISASLSMSSCGGSGIRRIVKKLIKI
ncbi:hypothetical protein DVH24_000533 [Malus domestica]|uniref:Uncharacterized protein n=1 Tax=Malus domestica TaxID=3750 RepID=A0A498J3Q0_MALDO|nr:hypothetical protein DVH24_000533 [Malus domestica]